jgi:hypothetical protein
MSIILPFAILTYQTHGLVQVFDRKAFLSAMDNTYQDPLSVEPSWLCLLNLVFAIGLMLATPLAGSPEEALVDKLHNEHADRAEVFYLNAKSLNDPLTGFEDADFWSVQALLLMTIYMLAKSKRNTAFALLGMAVRSAYALGLHREETMVMFTSNDQGSRRNLWRSLFVLDRFLALSLGRPCAISEDDCNGDTLKPSNNGISHVDYHSQPSFEQTAVYGLDAAVRSCQVIGTILQRVYQQRKISTKLAQEIADVCKVWPKAVAPVLQWRQAGSASASQGIAILHVNLFYCHSVILLTRPFFLYVLNTEVQRGVALTGRSRIRRSFPRMEKFSEACVIASTHTIALVQTAFEGGYLPRRNPIVIYFLFSAVLILLSNEFAQLYSNAGVEQCIRQAEQTVSYCSETDPQASRLLFIITTFREVVEQQRETRARQEHINLPPVQLKAPLNPFAPQTGMSPLDPALQGVQGPPQAHHPMPPMSQSYPTSPFLSHTGNGEYTGGLPFSASSPAVASSFQLPPRKSSSSTPTPMEPIPPPSGPHNPLSPHPSHAITPGTLSTSTPHPLFDPANPTMPFTSLLDVSTLRGDTASHSEEGSMPDDYIEFSSLWHWPSGQAEGMAGLNGSNGAQGGNDHLVPLFAVMEN